MGETRPPFMRPRARTAAPTMYTMYDPARYRKPGARGFTLLELLVVMVIIGLLAGFVAPRYFAQVGKSRVKAARAQIRSEEHTSELQSLRHLVCRLLLEKKKKKEYLRKEQQ